MKKLLNLLVISTLISLLQNEAKCAARGDSEAVKDLFKEFVSEFQSLNIPSIELGYVENLNNIQDLSGISNEIQMYFCDFCLADCQQQIGIIRTKYGNGNLQTPFGNILLNNDILNDGRTLKKEIIDKLSISSLMNIQISTC